MKAYDALFKLPDPALRTLLAPLKLPQGGTALDFGCGPGFVAAGMARFMGPQGRVIGVDVNKEFVQRAKKVAEEQKVAGRVTVHHVTDEKIPIPDESVDRVLCKNVLEVTCCLAPLPFRSDR